MQAIIKKAEEEKKLGMLQILNKIESNSFDSASHKDYVIKENKLTFN